MTDTPKYKKLTPLEQREKLIHLKAWTIEGGRLEREYQLKDFVSVMVFLNKAINPIEENQSYPRINIAYNRVKLSLFTNEAGSVTSMDFEMAEELDRLAGEPADAENKSHIKA